MQMEYDYLVVGSGLYGAVFAHEAKDRGKSVLVVDKRPYIAGNIYTENIVASTSTSTVPIFFILVIKMFGTILHGLRSSTVLRTHLWLTTRVSCIIFRSICTPLTRCRVL